MHPYLGVRTLEINPTTSTLRGVADGIVKPLAKIFGSAGTPVSPENDHNAI